MEFSVSSQPTQQGKKAQSISTNLMEILCAELCLKSHKEEELYNCPLQSSSTHSLWHIIQSILHR